MTRPPGLLFLCVANSARSQMAEGVARAEEVCPIFLSKARRLHWPLPDPTAGGGSEAEQLARFRRTRDELKSRIEALEPLK